METQLTFMAVGEPDYLCRCMRRHVSDLAWRPIIKGGDIDEIVVAMGGTEEARSSIDSVGAPR